MDAIELFGIKWEREMYTWQEHSVLYALASIKFIEYKNSINDVFLLTTDALTVLQQNDQEKPDYSQILSVIHENSVNETPCLICLDTQKVHLERAISGTIYEEKKWKLTTLEELLEN
jgi:hypothetical protein